MVKVNSPECEFKKSKFESFCSLYQLEFPKEYIEYLKKYNDAELEPNVVDIGNNECCIRYFYGTSNDEYSDICTIYEVYKNRMPSKFIPIADPDFGNQICMSLSQDTYGKIYFWDHETMDSDFGDICKINFQDMRQIANSFVELLNNIKESKYVVEYVKKNNFLDNVLQIIKRKNK